MSGVELTASQLEQLDALGESVDRLVTLDLTARGVIHPLYAAAREVQGGAPLTSLAARALLRDVGQGDVVLISTCMPVGTYPNAEQDGPVGAATLARSLILGLGAKPVIVTEERNRAVMEASLRSAGIYALPLDEAMSEPTASAVVAFTLDANEASAAAEALLARLAPTAIVAIERAGANERGEHHGARGNNVTEHNSKQDVLFELGRAQGSLTVCIGDGGNELGCALIRDKVVEHVPLSGCCNCACEGSIVPAFVPDVLVMAAVSNWGAYALEAAIAAMVERPEALHDAKLDHRVHSFAAMAGANNDGPRLLDLGSDAVDVRYHGYVLELLGLLVRGSRTPGAVYNRHAWPWLTNEEVK